MTHSKLYIFPTKVIPKDLWELLETIEDGYGLDIREVVNQFLIEYRGHVDARALSQTLAVHHSFESSNNIPLDDVIDTLTTAIEELELSLQHCLKLKSRKRIWVLGDMNDKIIEVEEY